MALPARREWLLTDSGGKPFSSSLRVSVYKIIDKAHWDGEFVLGWRVVASVGYDEAFNL